MIKIQYLKFIYNSKFVIRSSHLRRGIAYIEVLIASGILTAAIIPSYGYFADLMQKQTLGENYIKARNILETQIELQRAKSIEQFVEGQETVSTESLSSGQITTNLTNIDPGRPSLYQYEVQVSWQETGGQKSFTAATIIDPEGY